MGMIDISEKEHIHRYARARGEIELSEESVKAIRNGEVKKGDVFQVAEISAIQAVKRTPETIPHCHPIPIESVDFDSDLDQNTLKVECGVKAIYKTGVEMEALSGVNSALLTAWDMVKYLEKDEKGQYPDISIKKVSVLEKRKEIKDEP